jgi:hypothetical protein
MAVRPEELLAIRRVSLYFVTAYHCRFGETPGEPLHGVVG